MKKWIARLLVVVMMCTMVQASAKADVTESEVYEIIMSLQNDYPEGLPWTDENSKYAWKGGNASYSWGTGCVAFAYILSDAAFGTLKARKITPVHLEDLRVGDILRINNNTHTVIVLGVHESGVTIAEGNYDGAIHWGRVLPKSVVESADFMLTRYPTSASETTKPAEEPTPPVASESRQTTINNPLGKLAVYNGDTLVDYTGFDKFEGADFYFEHGVVRDDISGPVQIGSTWYAFDAGRVMTEKMLVPYDGGVFAFNNGTLDTTQNGLVTFNGEQFVFAAGQFQPNVYGAWHDPLSGDWVYVWAGQFYNTTDLVSYDGAIFYFINGKLALDFTGVVTDFQGAAFNIVNGQAQ